MTWGGYPDDLATRRERVHDRDDHICQECGTDDATYVRYRSPPPDGDHDRSNLETVCEGCYACDRSVQATVAEALANTCHLRLGYRFSNGIPIVLDIDPYGLAVYEETPYLVGYGHYHEEIRVLEAPRIKWADLVPISFTRPRDWDTWLYLAREFDAGLLPRVTRRVRRSL